MSDTKETDTNKSGGRKPLTTRSSSSGTVRQSFSHGRTKSVVVEKKKKRVVTQGGKTAAPSGKSDAAAKGPRPASGGAPSKLAEAAKKLGITEAELRARQEVLRKRREMEQAREADAKKKEAARERLKEEQERQLRETREREEAEARRKAEEEAQRKVEEEARQSAQAGKPARKGAGREAPAADPVAAQPEGPLNALGGRVKKAKERPENETRAPASKPRAEPRTRGKLTINSVLDDEDGGRQRSLASVKRARERERERRQGGGQQAEKTSREVKLPETITVQELANRMKERVAAVVKFMFQQGEPVRANDILDVDTAELIIDEFGHTAKRVSDADVEIGLEGEEDDPKDLKPRPPVVTIMGHVDHGKTSLLDALRETDVVAGEAGGITQHIGAYQVKLPSGDRISFLDTPGHAAFSAMRSRGANVTDIVILVVAADDGVMPQTIEAISHAKAAEVPIIVAVNKTDKPDAEPQKVLTELLQHDIQVEAMGGEVQAVEVSALKRKGLEELTEAITLQAELLELKANPDRPADGLVIESQLDKGRGAVATVLVQRGTLKRGDIVVAGSQWGKVRALVNERGQQVKEAAPALPVEVLGLDGAPDPGDQFVVVETEARAREITEYRDRVKREKAGASPTARASLEQLLTKLKDGSAEAEELPVVLKGDVQGSVEAISQSLDKISTDEVRARVIHGAVGGISESDVLLAQSSGAPIFAFNVRANKQARELAEREGVEIRYYSIIYELLDDVKDTLSGMLAPEKRETFIGYADILEVFNISKVGKVAGCRVTEGVVKRGCGVRLLRDDVVIHEGRLKTLKRFKDEVPEVTSGMECGMAFEKYDDMRVGDRIECFEVEEIQRKLD
jgi:translation initiation factor IF-2